MKNQTEIVLYLLKNYGLRISEILTLKYERILGDVIIFTGLKGSRDRYIRDEVATNAIKSICGNFKTGLVFSIRYQQIYRDLKEANEGMCGVKNARITSAFRHRYIREMKSEGKSVKEIQNEVGHKRKTTTEYYLKQK